MDKMFIRGIVKSFNGLHISTIQQLNKGKK
jgi:hypothetical protein